MTYLADRSTEGGKKKEASEGKERKELLFTRPNQTGALASQNGERGGDREDFCSGCEERVGGGA